MVGGVYIIFFLGTTIPYSSSVPGPDKILINVNFHEGNNEKRYYEHGSELQQYATSTGFLDSAKLAGVWSVATRNGWLGVLTIKQDGEISLLGRKSVLQESDNQVYFPYYEGWMKATKLLRNTTWSYYRVDKDGKLESQHFCTDGCNGIYHHMQQYCCNGTGSKVSGFGERPNILYIVVDDVGLADIGCFGNKTIPTPNIDKLCDQGMKLTHHLSTYTLCTPSRVSLLTGRYASRAGMARSPYSAPVTMYTAGRIGLPENQTTWSKQLKKSGYSTAAVGKWHMGWNKEKWGDQKHGPLGHGFDYFIGLPFTLTEEFGRAPTESFFSVNNAFKKNSSAFLYLLPELDIRGVTLASQLFNSLFTADYKEFAAILIGLLGLQIFKNQLGLVTLIVLFGIWFTKQHMTIFEERWYRRSDYMDERLNSHIMEMPGNKIIMQPIDQTRSSSIMNTKAINFIKKKSQERAPWLLYYPLTEAHTPLIVEDMFKGKSSHGAYGDTIIQMDAMIGRILDAIDEIGQTNSTFVYFTSDHGGHIDVGTEGGWNSPYSGGKGIAAREGGMRVPGIVRWPGKIKPGSVLDQPTSHMDLMPTLIEMTSSKMPDNKLDGKSILRHLKGESRRKIHSFMFDHCGIDIHAMRWNHKDGNIYKLVLKEPLYTNGLITDGSKAHCGGLCPCFDDYTEQRVTTHDKPKLYLIEEDPEQIRPIAGVVYERVVPTMLRKLKIQKRDEARTNMQAQLSKIWRVLPAPWLQPCCDFPLCRCDKTTNQSFATAQSQNGRTAQSQNGRTAQSQNGRTAQSQLSPFINGMDYEILPQLYAHQKEPLDD